MFYPQSMHFATHPKYLGDIMPHIFSEATPVFLSE